MDSTRTTRVRRHVASGILVAAGLGLVDALAATTPSGVGWGAKLLAPLVAAAIMVPAGACLGFVGYLLRGVVVPAAHTDLARARTGESWVVAHAVALGALVALGAKAAAGYVTLAVALQDETFRAQFTVLAWSIAVLGTIVLAGPLALVVHALLRWSLGRRPAVGRLVRPLAVAAIVWVAWSCLDFARVQVALLGGVWVVPYGCAALLLVVLAWTEGVRGWVARSEHARGFWPACALAVVAAAVGTSAWPVLRQVLARSAGPSRVAAWLARATDVDGDGQSGLFGGTDCAPFDGQRSAFAVDAPGNGIDEDCDGRDARNSGAVRASATHPLPAALVRPYHVVLVVIDGFRADRLARRGDSLTPNLDRLARESIVFDEAFSQSPSTRISFPSFLSGREPAHLRWVRRDGALQSDGTETMLAEWLRRRGHRTGLVVNTWIHTRMRDIFRGYDEVFDMRRVGEKAIPLALSGTSATARAAEFIARGSVEPGAGRPFFLTLYYDDPHAPYLDRRGHGFPAAGPRALDRYESEIRYVDREVGQVIDHLRVKPEVWANTVIVVTSDHGEEFGEHGGNFHDRACYRESTHVPLIVRVPGLTAAQAPRRVALIDIVPTVLALVGETRAGTLDGRNLLLADAAGYAHVADATVTCTYFPDQRPTEGLLHAVRDDRWLHVRNVSRGTDEVYDTRVDRAERHDLASTPVAREIVRRLSARARLPAFVDP